MPITHKNRVSMTVSGTPGTGTITLNAASSGYQTFAAAYAANATVDVLVVDGTAWEVARSCTYTNSGTTLTRGTLEASSTGSAISLTSATVVSQIPTAAWGSKLDALLSIFGDTEIAVTGTVTATIDSMHLCTGTSAGYTVTLPAASGNAGKHIGFRMGSASALTKLVTIDGNASETIDGALTRVMWAEETAILLCDGSNWFKIAGKSRAMSAGIYRASTQSSVSASTVVKVLCTTLDFDASGLLADTTNSRITIQRPGTYVVVGKVQGSDTGDLARFLTILEVNGSQVGSAECPSVTSSYPTPNAARTQTLAAGDQVELYVYFSGSTAKDLVGSSGKESQINVLESPSW